MHLLRCWLSSIFLNSIIVTSFNFSFKSLFSFWVFINYSLIFMDSIFFLILHFCADFLFYISLLSFLSSSSSSSPYDLPQCFESFSTDLFWKQLFFELLLPSIEYEWLFEFSWFMIDSDSFEETFFGEFLSLWG